MRVHHTLYITDYKSAYRFREELQRDLSDATYVNAQHNVWYPDYPRQEPGKLPGDLSQKVRRADAVYCLAKQGSLWARLEYETLNTDTQIHYLDSLSELEELAAQQPTSLSKRVA